MELSDSVKTVKGVGDKSLALLQKLNIYTVRDLLRHYPTDYDNFKMPVHINTVSEGETVTVEGAVSRVSTRPAPRGSDTAEKITGMFCSLAVAYADITAGVAIAMMMS